MKGAVVTKKLLLWLLMTATLLTACGGGQEKVPTPAPAEPVTIIFTTSGTGGRNPLQPYRELASRFQEVHPHITVELKTPESGAGRTMKNIAKSAGCFSWVPDFQDSDNLEAILNLGPFLEPETALADDFYPSLLEQFTRHGQLWGLPHQAMPEVIRYNRDLFDAAGLNPRPFVKRWALNGQPFLRPASPRQTVPLLFTPTLINDG